MRAEAGAEEAAQASQECSCGISTPSWWPNGEVRELQRQRLQQVETAVAAAESEASAKAQANAQAETAGESQFKAENADQASQKCSCGISRPSWWPNGEGQRRYVRPKLERKQRRRHLYGELPAPWLQQDVAAVAAAKLQALAGAEAHAQAEAAVESQAKVG